MLKATKRTILGKKVQSLRTSGQLPAVIYGHNVASLPLMLDHKEFLKIYKDSGESGLIDLSIDDQPAVKVLISEVDLNPVTDEIRHANFRQVSLKEKITVQVPIELIGESPAVKSGEGIVLQLISELEVTCLPQDIPHEIKVDVSKLEKIDDAIHVRELPIDHSKVEISHDSEDLVVKIDYAQMLEVEETKTEEELIADVEVEKEKETPPPAEAIDGGEDSSPKE